MRKNKNPDNQFIYFDMTANERDNALRFLLSAIIKTKEEHPQLVRKQTGDEDVNVYLAHLMFAIALPEYHEMADPYLSKHSSDIMEWVKSTEDRTVRYFIYKVNADHLLLHTSLFQDLTHKSKRKTLFQATDGHYQELAAQYYAEAAKYHQQMNRKKTGIAFVLEKMAADFKYYQRIIELVREDYFTFVQTFREKHFSVLENEIAVYEKENFYDQKMDEFLSAFYEWNQAQNDAMRAKVAQLAADLKRMNPEFQFHFPRKDSAA